MGFFFKRETKSSIVPEPIDAEGWVYDENHGFTQEFLDYTKQFMNINSSYHINYYETALTAVKQITSVYGEKLEYRFGSTTGRNQSQVFVIRLVISNELILTDNEPTSHRIPLISFIKGGSVTDKYIEPRINALGIGFWDAKDFIAEKTSRRYKKEQLQSEVYSFPSRKSWKRYAEDITRGVSNIHVQLPKFNISSKNIPEFLKAVEIFRYNNYSYMADFDKNYEFTCVIAGCNQTLGLGMQPFQLSLRDESAYWISEYIEHGFSAEQAVFNTIIGLPFAKANMVDFEIYNLPLDWVLEVFGSTDYWRYAFTYCENHWNELRPAIPHSVEQVDDGRVLV